MERGDGFRSRSPSKKGSRSSKKPVAVSPKSPRSPRRLQLGSNQLVDQQEEPAVPQVDYEKELAEHIQQLQTSLAEHASAHEGSSHGAAPMSNAARAQTVTMRFARCVTAELDLCSSRM